MAGTADEPSMGPLETLRAVFRLEAERTVQLARLGREAAADDALEDIDERLSSAMAQLDAHNVNYPLHMVARRYQLGQEDYLVLQLALLPRHGEALVHAMTTVLGEGESEPRLSHAGAKADQWIPVRPGKDVVLVMAISKLLIDAGQIDRDFLVTYTNAPQLVGADGKIVRNDKGEALVWDSKTNTAQVFAEGVEPALSLADLAKSGQPLSGRPMVGGRPVRTGFDVYRDSLREYADDVIRKRERKKSRCVHD